MTVLVAHPTGNANLRAVLRAAVATGRLDSFWTALAVPPALTRVPLGGGLARELARRSFPEVPWRRVRVRPTRELVRLAARGRWAPLTAHERGWASVDAVYRGLDRAVAAHLSGRRGRGVGAVYAYEDGALAAFRAAEVRGVRRIYDLPIAHWRSLRAILAEEAEREPAWAATLDGLADGPAKLARKDEELARAERVVVASSFTRRSLEAHFGDALAVTVVPYGAPPPRRREPTPRPADAPLHVLFAGHLAQRKGLAYLVAALERLDVPWRLTLAGPAPAAPPTALARLFADPRCTRLGHVPHATLLEHMDRAHVFVFPSLVEGFGLVLLEAMSAGLPVITTPHTAGPDILTDGREGFLVPIRDADAIAERLAGLHGDEARRRAMGGAALARARASNWAAYEGAIGALLAEMTT